MVLMRADGHSWIRKPQFTHASKTPVLTCCNYASYDIYPELWELQGDRGGDDFAGRQRGGVLGNGLKVHAVVLIVTNHQQLVNDLNLPVKD